MFKLLNYSLKPIIIPKRNLYLQTKQFYQFSTNIDYSKDYFKILKVNENATSEEIKKQYYKLVKQYHPDINKDNEEYFKQINEAYEVLGDDAKRNDYMVMKQNPFTNDSQSYTQQGQQSSYGKYYNYGNRKSQSYDYKRYEQTYYSTSDTQRQQGGFYNSEFRNSKFYQEFNNPYGQSSDFEAQMSVEEKMRMMKKKILAFSFVILSFYLIFDVLVYRLLYTGPTYKVYDPQSGQTYIADQTTFENLQRRGYDTSYVTPSEQYYRRRQNEAQYNQNNFNYDQRRERI